MTQPQPASRDLEEVIAAIDVVEEELRFQIARIDAMHFSPDGGTNSQQEYLLRMRQRYDEAVGTIVTLGRYQRGRLQRRVDAQRVGDLARRDDVSAAGHASPYLDEEE